MQRRQETQEVFIDFRRGNSNHQPNLTICGSAVEKGEGTKNLEVLEVSNLQKNTSAVIKKACAQPPSPQQTEEGGPSPPFQPLALVVLPNWQAAM